MKKSKKALLAGGLAGAIGIGALYYSLSYRDALHEERVEKPNNYKTNLRNVLSSFLTQSPNIAGFNNFLYEMARNAKINPDSVVRHESGAIKGKLTIPNSSLAFDFRIGILNADAEQEYSCILTKGAEEILPDGFSNYYIDFRTIVRNNNVARGTAFIELFPNEDYKGDSSSPSVSGYCLVMDENGTDLTPIISYWDGTERQKTFGLQADERFLANLPPDHIAQMNSWYPPVKDGYTDLRSFSLWRELLSQVKR